MTLTSIRDILPTTVVLPEQLQSALGNQKERVVDSVDKTADSYGIQIAQTQNNETQNGGEG